MGNLDNAKKIPIRVSGREGTCYRAQPVTFGIPFGDGELAAGTPLRLTDDHGHAVPIQTECLTTWRDDLEFVKWLLVDMQADQPDGGDREYVLEFPADSPPVEPVERVQVEERGEFLTVDTGVLRLRVRRAVDPFAGGEVRTDSGWRSLFQANPGPYLYMKDGQGRLRDSRTAGPAPTVTVEESGPLRACLRIDGYHAAVDGDGFCPYTLRVHLYAGKSDLRIHHTFVFDQEPHAVDLSAVGVWFPLVLGGAPKAAIGGDTDTHRGVDCRELRLLQTDDRSYTVTGDGETLAAGNRAPGWASLNGADGAVVVVIRNCWQEFPKGLLVDRSGIEVEIWPERFRERLSFATPFEAPPILFVGADGAPIREEAEVERLLAEHPTAPLNLKSFDIRSREDAIWVEEVIDKYARGRAMTYNDTGTRNGTGAAKTTEIHLRLSADTIDDAEAATLAQTVQEPLVGTANPVHVCATRALGHFFHAGDPRFGPVDDDLENIYDRVVVEPQELCRLYGMLRYGNMVCSHSSAVGHVYLLYRDTEPEKALRYVGPYNNEAVDQIMSVWGHFARTGKREHGLIAQNFSRCVADVSFVHASPGHPERVGLIHGHSGHPLSGELSPSHSIITGILADYYFTGNRRLLDVAREAADHIVDTREPAGILSCRNGILHREFTGPLSILMDVYQATWDDKYGDVAARSLNWLLRTAPEPGRLPNSILTGGERGDEALVQSPNLPEVAWGNKYHLYEPAMRLFPSKTLADFLVAEADYWVWKSPREMLNYQCTTVCFAYDQTGDVCYAAYANRLLSEHFHAEAESVQKGERIGFDEEWYSGFIPRLVRIVAEASARDPGGFAAAAAAWWDKRQAMPDREPEVRPDAEATFSLGRLSTEPHPE